MLQEKNILIHFALNRVVAKVLYWQLWSPLFIHGTGSVRISFLLKLGVSILFWRDLWRTTQPLACPPLLPAQITVLPCGHLYSSSPAKISHTSLMICNSLEMLSLGWVWMSARRMNSTDELFQITEVAHPHCSACRFFNQHTCERKTFPGIDWLGYKTLGWLLSRELLK